MRRCSSKEPGRRTSAFSLAELLATIGIVGVLLAILLPALSRARSAARETVTLSNLRELGATFEQYTQRYGAYPFAPQGTQFRVSPPDASEISLVSGGYWDLSVYWTALMHDIAPWREHFATWIGPGGIEDPERPWKRPFPTGTGVPSYRLSHTFFARPELWAPATADSPDFYRPVRTRDVYLPASKVMLWDAELTHLAGQPNADRDRRPMLFADGHVAARRLSEASAPPTIPFKETEPVQDTPDGVHGHDY